MLRGRTAVVTGANCGIGKVTAQRLAEEGAQVILACRSAERGRAAQDAISAALPQTGGEGGVEFRQLDLSSFESIRAFAEALLAERDVVDVLVNSAGVNSATAKGGLTADGFELCFGVNYLGHFLLTGLLLPALQRSDAPRVVNVSSVMHHHGSTAVDEAVAREAHAGSYSTSKLAMNLFSLELARRHPQITAVTVNPGAVRSEIWRAMPLRSLVDPVMACLFLSVEQGAATSVFAATSPSIRGGEYVVPYRLRAGLALPFEYLGPFAGPQVVRASAKAYDAVAAAALWERSGEWVGLSW